MPPLPRMLDRVHSQTVVYGLFIGCLLVVYCLPFPNFPECPTLCSSTGRQRAFVCTPALMPRSHAPARICRPANTFRIPLCTVACTVDNNLITIFVNLSSSIHVYHEHVRARGPASLCVLPLSYYLYSYLVYLFHPSLLLRYECCGAS